MRLLAQMSERLGAEHYGEERAEPEAAKAERIRAQEMKRRNWTAVELQTQPKGAAEQWRWRRIFGGDDDDGGMDCGAFGHGQPGLPQPPDVSSEKVPARVAIIKN